jgi:hypothetical protein
MSKDKTLRLALEALEKISMGGDPRWADQTITDIKAALEAKDEPVADHFDCGTYIGSHIGKEIRHSIGDDLPPQRTWVGLTDEEIDVIYEQHHNQYGECESVNWGYERAIEAKLKEKNT